MGTHGLCQIDPNLSHGHSVTGSIGQEIRHELRGKEEMLYKAHGEIDAVRRTNLRNNTGSNQEKPGR